MTNPTDVIEVVLRDPEQTLTLPAWFVTPAVDYPAVCVIDGWLSYVTPASVERIPIHRVVRVSHGPDVWFPGDRGSFDWIVKHVRERVSS